MKGAAGGRMTRPAAAAPSAGRGASGLAGRLSSAFGSSPSSPHLHGERHVLERLVLAECGHHIGHADSGVIVGRRDRPHVLAVQLRREAVGWAARERVERGQQRWCGQRERKQEECQAAISWALAAVQYRERRAPRQQPHAPAASPPPSSSWSAGCRAPGTVRR